MASGFDFPLVPTSYNQIALGYISWSQLSITATYTLETVLFIINNQTNSTRTSTVKNTDINFANISIPTNTNSAGTVTTVIPVGDGNTITATFPSTPYEDYPSTYAFCGTLPTVISGTSTCLTIQSETCAISGYSASGLNSNNGVFTFPSHPPISVGVQTGLDLSQDPRGWTYTAMVDTDCDAGGGLLKPLFPDLEFWSCGGVMTCVSPAIALNTALFLTVTSTSHEVGPATPPTTIPQAPAAPQPNLPKSSLVAATSNPPVPNDTPVGNQITSELQQAPNNEPTPAQPTTTSLSPPSQSISPNQPAPNNQPAANNSPSPVQQAATGQPAPNNQPAANNLPTSVPPAVQPLEGPKQSAPNNRPAANPPPTPSATIISIAVTSTNAQASILVSTAPVAAIPVLQTSIQNGGQTVVSTSFSPLIPNAPITIVPGAINSARHPVSPIAFLPTAITTTNAQGITTTSTGTAVIIPIVVSSTNSQGQVVLSSSLLTAAATASANVIITSTDAKGSIVSSTAQVPAVILTTTNAQGSQIIITSPITQPLIAFGTSTQDLITGTTNLPILTIGTQTVTANSASQYIIASQTLTPGGAITISGTPISLAPSATALIIGSSTISLDSSATILPPLTIGTQVVTANKAGQYIVDGLTLTPGGVVTVSGTRVSLEAGDTGVVVGTSTEALGALITAGLGSGPGGNGTSGVKPFTGGGVKASRIGNLSLWLEGFIMMFGMRALMGL
ncbi:hypothetical protein JMJ35_008908 [Cladonia borealis]|uniref:Uncharacterized protein n=1 Tax=Cladonia borealis TaxID=184061 RepID=A0AA39UYK5_9LECA|nr:hypothetical protein JMJ35_008908 [Cladonia borealis]